MNANAEVKQMNIGPEHAKKLLGSLFESQRPVRGGTVSMLSNEMKNGQWKLSSDCIVLINGKLANGQHRMQAVCIAVKPMPFLVMETTDEDLFKVIDCGRSRTVGDVLGGEYAAQVASVARWAALYDLDAFNRTGRSRGKETQATRSLVIDFARENHEKILSCVQYTASLNGKFKVVNPTTAAALMFIGQRDSKHPEKVTQFIQNVYDGEARADAANDFRERMIRSKSRGAARLDRQHIFGLMIKSLRSCLQGTRIGALKIQEGEPFPRLK